MGFCVFVYQENFNKNWALCVYLFMSAFLPRTLLIHTLSYKDTSLTPVMLSLERVAHVFALSYHKNV